MRPVHDPRVDLEEGHSLFSALQKLIADAGYRRTTIPKTHPGPVEVEVNCEQTASKTPSPIKTPAPAKVKTVVDSEGLPVDVEVRHAREDRVAV